MVAKILLFGNAGYIVTKYYIRKPCKMYLRIKQYDTYVVTLDWSVKMALVQKR